MRGNSLREFIDDLLTTGGPEKEFTFRHKRFFLETVYHSENGQYELYVDLIEGANDTRFSFWGKTFWECVNKFEKAKIFDGLNIYEAEQEITVLFG